jgi:hypothetical protein
VSVDVTRRITAVKALAPDAMRPGAEIAASGFPAGRLK